MPVEAMPPGKPVLVLDLVVVGVTGLFFKALDVETLVPTERTFDEGTFFDPDAIGGHAAAISLESLGRRMREVVDAA